MLYIIKTDYLIPLESERQGQHWCGKILIYSQSHVSVILYYAYNVSRTLLLMVQSAAAVHCVIIDGAGGCCSTLCNY